MKKYLWEIDGYKFEMLIGNDKTRWNDEGVLQSVKLTVDGISLLDNNWGIEHNYNILTKISKSDSGLNNSWKEGGHLLLSGNNGIAFHIREEMKIINGEDYIDFMKWIKSCLSSKEEQIKIKMDKILSKI